MFRALCILSILCILVSGVSAQTVLDSQAGNGQSSEINFVAPDGSNNYESVDDIDVTGVINRVVVTGYMPNFTTWGFQGVWVRFYAHTASGPGALQAEYFVASGTAGLTFDTTGGTYFDVTLASGFAATGPHYLGVQPKVGWWNWNSANALRSSAYKRVNGGAWAPIANGLTFSVYGTASGPGRIDGLSSTSATRSGMVIVNGANLGSSGQLLIDGLAAPYASWTPTEIVAYVPEAARLGSMPVQAVTAGGASNTVFLTVTGRAAAGRLLWQLRMDAAYSKVRPVRAADGSVYAIDVAGRLYALAADGALRWIARGAGNKGLALAPDGTIYTGSENDVRAFAPDGALKWTFVQNPRAFILLGLTADRLGNVYGVASSGMGVFSLTPAGQERWRTPEPYNRPIVSYGALAIGMNGGVEQLYFYANARMRAVRTQDGGSVFTGGAARQPVVSPVDGTVHAGASAYSPAGQFLWSDAAGWSPSDPDVGSNGIHYYVNVGTDLAALSTGGSRLWSLTLPKSVFAPDVDPANSVVLVAGAGTTSGFAQGVSTASRTVSWEQTLPSQETSVFNPATGQFGFLQIPDTRAVFSGDGKAAYLVTAMGTGSGVRARSFFTAIDTTAGTAPPPAYTMRVASINLVASMTTPYVLVDATVRIVDQAGQPVIGATVNGRWRLPNGSTFNTTATTPASGVVVFSQGYSKGTYTFTVTGVSKPGSTFDSRNSVLSGTLRVR